MAAPLGHGFHPHSASGPGAELLVAQRLARAGFLFARDVPTPAGRTCDFHARNGKLRLAIHVKSLDMVSERSQQPPPVLRALQRIRRGVVLGLWWRTTLGSEALQSFGRVVRQFARRATVGEECAMRDPHGELLGRCRLLGAGVGNHALIATGAEADPGALAPRALRLMVRAHSQFEPRITNVIAVCAPPEAVSAIDIAVLGTPQERWDQFPPRGQRVAIGRGEDGLFHGNSRREARYVIWLPLVDGADTGQAGRIWERAGAPADKGLAEALVAIIQPRRQRQHRAGG